jgi:Flp pilus assembly protein TadG
MNQHRMLSSRRTENQHPLLSGKGVSRRRGSRGQSLVEFAVVLPVLMLILILLIAIPGFSAWDQLAAVNIADQAAQDGANATSAPTVTYANEQDVACGVAVPEARQQMQQMALALQSLSVTCRADDASGNPSNPSDYGVEGFRRIVVTISYSVRLWLPGAVTLSSTVTGWARIERATGP